MWFLMEFDSCAARGAARVREFATEMQPAATNKQHPGGGGLWLCAPFCWRYLRYRQRGNSAAAQCRQQTLWRGRRTQKSRRHRPPGRADQPSPRRAQPRVGAVGARWVPLHAHPRTTRSGIRRGRSQPRARGCPRREASRSRPPQPPPRTAGIKHKKESKRRARNEFFAAPWWSGSGGKCGAAVVGGSAVMVGRTRATRSVWSACATGRPATAMNASPIVSTLYSPCLWHSPSNFVNRRSSIAITFSGACALEKSVNPTMSLKNTVTCSNASGFTFCPAASASTTCC